LFPKNKPSLHGHIRGAAKFTKEKKACAYTSFEEKTKTHKYIIITG
jgi:hypothetical protein